jgi:hypothetical protein
MALDYGRSQPGVNTACSNDKNCTIVSKLAATLRIAAG